MEGLQFQERRGLRKAVIDAEGNLTVERSIGSIVLRRTRCNLVDVSSIRFWSASAQFEYGWVVRSGMIISLRKGTSWTSRWKPIPSLFYHPADEDRWSGFYTWEAFQSCLKRSTRVRIDV